jgi:hypothetical protein
MLEKKYKIDEEKMFVKCFTTVDDEEEIIKYNKNKDIQQNFNILKDKNNSKSNNNIMKLNSRNFDLKKEYKTNNHYMNEYDFKIKESSISDKNYLNNSKKIKNNFSLNSSQRNYYEQKYFNPPVSLERENVFNENYYKEPDNLNYLKDIILNNDLSAFEKYETLKNLKLSKQDIKSLMEKIINNLDLDNNINISIISEICNFALSNIMIFLIPILKQISNNTQLKGNKTYIKKEINNTILILENLKTNFILIKYQDTLMKKEKLKESNKKKNVDIIEYENEMFYNPDLGNDETENNQNDNFNFDELIKLNKKK